MKKRAVKQKKSLPRSRSKTINLGHTKQNEPSLRPEIKQLCKRIAALEKATEDAKVNSVVKYDSIATLLDEWAKLLEQKLSDLNTSIDRIDTQFPNQVLDVDSFVALIRDDPKLRTAFKDSIDIARRNDAKHVNRTSGQSAGHYPKQK